MDSELESLSVQLGKALSERALTLATAESCTGGWVAELVTDTAGSSGWFERGFITYSNQSKADMLGVRMDTLAHFGAVSEETAQEMAAGAIKFSRADWAISITGIAGPGGGSLGKPVGTVCFAWCRRGAEPISEIQHFAGDRRAVRRRAVLYALRGLLQQLGA
ncbi:MAG TPA: nicotinamide-nucleotide amidase [Rhodocyclaceae bacterium]|jgi:nicotinamide-nucleotide amidase|nr:nicotinamide-nucleotide amidase [Rhodocyclaceae bacterium]